MIKAIVFDFGNVIGFFDHHRATRRLAEHCGLSAEEIYRRVYGAVLEDDYESGRLSSVQYMERVRQLCGLHCSDDFFRDAYGDIFWPNQRVCDLLPKLKQRYRLLLGSNTNELHARWFRRQFADVLQSFDAIVLSYEIGTRKPRPEFFHHCQRLAGCAPNECLFIDDLASNVAGALAFGWQGVVYADAPQLEKELHARAVIF